MNLATLLEGHPATAPALISRIAFELLQYLLPSDNLGQLFSAQILPTHQPLD